MLQQIESIEDIQHLLLYGPDDWKQYGNVTVRYSGDLAIFNYTDKAQYEARWNFFELVSRGLILNRFTGEVVARPFDKFFNWGEGGRKSDATIVSVTEKMDGSLGILYRVGDEFRIATRGAFDSEQAKWATTYLNAHHDLTGFAEAWTLLFEIVYPDNRVVVDYGGFEGLVLLAARDRFDGQYAPFDIVQLIADYYDFKTPAVSKLDTVDEVLLAKNEFGAECEGFVVEFADGQRFKFKGDEYLRLHKLISSLSFKNTLEAIQSGTVETVRASLPDEFLGQFNAWVTEIESTVSSVKAETQRLFEQAPQSSRKDFALWVTANHKESATYLFAALDGKPLEPYIYRLAFVNRVAELPEGKGIVE